MRLLGMATVAVAALAWAIWAPVGASWALGQECDASQPTPTAPQIQPGDLIQRFVYVCGSDDTSDHQAEGEAKDDKDLPIAIILSGAILLPLAVLVIGSLMRPKGGGH